MTSRDTSRPGHARRLEARPTGWWSSVHALSVDGRPYGRVRGRWFSENMDIELADGAGLQLKRRGFFGGRFELTRTGGAGVVAAADRDRFLSRGWSLELGTGPARLESAGIFNCAYLVRRAGETLARVDRLGWFRRGWIAVAERDLGETDLLLVGLVYHTILDRRRRSS